MKIREFVPLAGYTSYGIGGPARYFCEPSNPKEIKSALSFALKRNIPYYVLGRGTNVLISDAGLAGMVIHLGEKFARLKVAGHLVTAEGGLPLTKLIHTLAEKNLGGFEALAGIPGTIAGAVVMNAGAYRVFIGDFINGLDVLTPTGQFKTMPRDKLGFAYRTSIFQTQSHHKYIILRTHLRVLARPKAEIKETIAVSLKKRRQHPQLPSCGSTFRNPVGIPAGKLIDEMGLKGTRRGQAQIAPQHGNFIVNLGGATAQDVYGLIRFVQDKVWEERGIALKTEVKLWGEFENPPK
ncbi:MAG: UDP-N-acetylmuramate dehydrogenase [Firmicutes bacterium]|nr:UDP-N-acetylmuramate dehydrogenase [Bacillota bacterium]